MPLSPHRQALAGLLFAMLVALFAVGPASAQAAPQPQYGPIASTALKYVGTHGGQCWTFARNVIQEATGRSLGFDYRQGFFDIGAIEVTAAEARDGDIIQLANDANTSATASYPGLHTAIILENLGDGVFNAVDSNQNWDEWVGLRPNYKPYAAAARYAGISVHIYRIEGGAPAGSAVQPGERARVNTPGDVLNLRSAPGLDGPITARLAHGTEVTVMGGPTTAGGFRWVKVLTPNGQGWVADIYLSRVTTAASATITYRSVVPMAVSGGTLGQ